MLPELRTGSGPLLLLLKPARGAPAAETAVIPVIPVMAEAGAGPEGSTRQEPPSQASESGPCRAAALCSAP